MQALVKETGDAPPLDNNRRRWLYSKVELLRYYPLLASIHLIGLDWIWRKLASSLQKQERHLMISIPG